MSEELKKLVEDLGKAFSTFKAENDARIKEIESKNHADPVLAEKVERIAKDITDKEIARQKVESQIDAIEKAVAKMEAGGIGGKNSKDKVYSSIGEQLLDVVAMAAPDTGSSVRAAALGRLNKVQAAASGANETIPSEGGFLVGTDEATMLDRGTIATGLLSQRCFNVTASAGSDRLRLNLVDESSRANGSRFGGIQVYMKAEADSVTASKPKFREAEWNLHDCMGLMYATGDLLKDAGALTAVVNKWFPMEFGFKIDDLIVNGTGAGMPLGIIQSGCKVEQAIESGQVRATDPILYENIVKMYARLLSSSDASAVWFVNRAILPYIMLMTLPIGTGGAPVFLPPNGAAGQPYMTLLNKPIIPIEQCQAPATAGDIILADLNEYLLFTKGGIEAAASIHVKFIYDEMTFRWIYRLDGAPLRNKTLTPYKGGASATQGPFITLAAS